MTQIILILILVWIVYRLYTGISRFSAGGKKASIFDNNYIEVKHFYMRQFGFAPCVCFVNNVDAGKIFEYIKGGYAGDVLTIHQRNYYNWQRNRQEFSKTIFTLENRRVIEVGSDYAEILFTPDDYSYANRLMDLFVTYKAAEKEEDYEINIITLSNTGLELKQLDIKPTPLDIDLYYNDDFKAIDEIKSKGFRKRMIKASSFYMDYLAQVKQLT